MSDKISVTLMFWVSIFIYFLTFTNVYAGVSATFADLILENLQPGGSYNLRKLKNVPFIIQNKGKETVDAKIEVKIPRADTLLKGYEPIPDPSWIVVIPDKFRLGSQEKGISEIIISIPEDEKLVGRHFQAHFNCSGIAIGPPSQLTIATGVETRIRFSIGSMGPDSLLQEKKRKVMYSLNFEFDPTNVNIKDKIELGKKIDLKKEKNVKLNLINKASDPINLTLKAVPYDTSIYGSAGDYEIGDPKFLKIKPEKLKLKGETIEKLKLYLEIPDEEKYKNKKFLFLIQAEVINHVPVEIVSKLFITTK